MLRVEESAQRRFVFLGGVIVVFLGGLILSGFLERFSNPSPYEAGISPEDTMKARERAKQFRQLRAEAAVLAKKGQWNDVLRFLDAPENARITTPYLRAEAAMRAGQIEDAKKGFLQFMPADNPVSTGTRLMLDGKMEEYRQFCEKTVSSVNLPEKGHLSQDDVMRANNTAWLCVLAPNALTNYDKVIMLAKRGVEDALKRDKANFMNTVGAIQYRAGQPKEAISTLLEAEKVQPEPFNWPFLALAYHNTGNDTEANRYLTRLRDHLTQTFGKPPESSRHELLLFFHETETVLGGSTVAAK